VTSPSSRAHLLRSFAILLGLLPLAAPASARQGVCPTFGTFAQQVDDLEWPTAIAVDSAGNFAVLERDASRIRLFAKDGSERGRLEAVRSSDRTAQQGDAPWHLAMPADERPPAALAYTADDRLTIVAPSRIALFDPSGVPWKIATGIQLAEPVAAIWHRRAGATEDSLFVVDRGAGAIVRFDASLVEQERISGLVARPSGIAFAEDGSMFVADEDRDEISRWSPEGKLIKRFGARGSFPGLFNAPRGLVVRGDCLYVTDELNHRITVHDFDGRFRSFWGMHAVIPRQGEGAIHYPVALAVTPDASSAIVVEPFERRVQRFTISDPNEAMNAAMPAREGVQSHFGPAVACDGELLALEEPETSSLFVFDLRDATPIHVTTFGGSGVGPDKQARITALSIDASTHMLTVADIGSRRLSHYHLARDRSKPLKLDPFMGTLVRSWDLDLWNERVRLLLGPATTVVERTPELVGFARHAAPPEADAIALWTLDRRSGRLVGMDETLVPVRVMETGLVGASGLAADTDGGFVTTLPERGEVLRIASDGRILARLRGQGSDPGAEPLRRPTAVHVSERGELWVTDAARDALVVLDREDRVLRVIGRRGGSDGEFWAPDGIARFTGATAVERGERVVVIDRGNHRAQLFSIDGTWLMTFGLGRAYTRPREQGQS
jgi:hypothetical protein